MASVDERLDRIERALGEIAHLATCWTFTLAARYPTLGRFAAEQQERVAAQRRALVDERRQRETARRAA